MSERLSDILVVSDMDGTLLTEDKTLPACVLETIRLFTLLGGHFTVATGRTQQSVAMYPQLARLVEPAITVGGGVLYNFEKDEPLKTAHLPPLAARAVLRDVLENFPDIGAMVFGSDMRLYQLAESQELFTLVSDEQMTYFARPVEDLPEDWIKVLFAAPPEVLAEVQGYVQARTYPGVYFVPTSPTYFEVMPKGVSKGTALLDLCAHLGIDAKNTYAIGDYYNDLEIMRQAGTAVAVQNAPPEIREQADEVIDSNENAGVAQFLYSLIGQFGNG